MVEHVRMCQDICSYNCVRVRVHERECASGLHVHVLGCVCESVLL